MKIKMKEMSYKEVLQLPRLQHKLPLKPQLWLATIVRIVCVEALWKTKFTYTKERMELVKDQPCLILMNHSSFTDMKRHTRFFIRKSSESLPLWMP